MTLCLLYFYSCSSSPPPTSFGVRIFVLINVHELFVFYVLTYRQNTQTLCNKVHVFQEKVGIERE